MIDILKQLLKKRRVKKAFKEFFELDLHCSADCVNCPEERKNTCRVSIRMAINHHSSVIQLVNAKVDFISATILGDIFGKSEEGVEKLKEVVKMAEAYVRKEAEDGPEQPEESSVMKDSYI